MKQKSRAVLDSKEIALGVSLIDINSMIRPMLRRPPTLRPMSGVHRLFVHHSGAIGASGIKGAINSTSFVLNKREPRFEMPGYHLWIPREPQGSEVEVYQIAPFDWRCWHTGGANGHGIGLCVQGNTSREPMTAHQEEGLEAVLPFIQEEVLRPCPPGEPWLSWHSEGGRWGGSTKPQCPGKDLEAWLVRRRNGTDHLPSQ